MTTIEKSTHEISIFRFEGRYFVSVPDLCQHLKDLAELHRADARVLNNLRESFESMLLVPVTEAP